MVRFWKRADARLGIRLPVTLRSQVIYENPHRNTASTELAVRLEPDTIDDFWRRVTAMFCGAANGDSKTGDPRAERPRRPAHMDIYAVWLGRAQARATEFYGPVHTGHYP